MKIYANQVESHINKNLASVYLIAGDEVLLQQEAADQLRTKARAQGFTERELYFQSVVLIGDNYFRTQEIYHSLQLKKLLSCDYQLARFLKKVMSY